MTISVFTTHGASGFVSNPDWAGEVGNYCVCVFPMYSTTSADDCALSALSHDGLDFEELDPGTPVYFADAGAWASVAIWGGEVTGADMDNMHFTTAAGYYGFLVFELQSDVDEGIWGTDGTNDGSNDNDPPANFPPLSPSHANEYYVAGSITPGGTGIDTQTGTGDPDDDGFTLAAHNPGGGGAPEYFFFADGPVSSPDTATPSFTWTDDLYPSMGAVLVTSVSPDPDNISASFYFAMSG